MRFLVYRLTLFILAFLLCHNSYGSVENSDARIYLLQEEDRPTVKLRDLNSKLLQAMTPAFDFDKAKGIYNEIENLDPVEHVSDTSVLFDYYYLSGIYLLYTSRYSLALEKFFNSAALKEAESVVDIQYAKCLNNISMVWLRMGDLSKSIEAGKKALWAKKIASGNDSSSLAANYLNLSSIYGELNDIDKSVEMAERGLLLTSIYPDKIKPSEISALYHSICSGLERRAEYSKALSYAKKAMDYYDLKSAGTSESLQLLLDLSASLYSELGESEMAEYYYKTGISKITLDNLSSNFSLFDNYSNFLASNQRFSESREILGKGLEMVRDVFGTQSREYCQMLTTYARLIYKTTGDGSESLDLLKECFPYIKIHSDDYSLKNYVLYSFADILIKEKRPEEGLRVLDDLLGNDVRQMIDAVPAEDEMSLPVDLHYLKNILSLKYNTLNGLASESSDAEYTLKAIETGKLLISVFDNLRMGMSEEESRNYLSENAREYYTGLVDNYSSLYQKTDNDSLLSSAFEYAERGKVAAFLASMREISATRFSLPSEMAHLENDIRNRIGAYREMIASEKNKTSPDSLKILIWERNSFALLRSRDSLVQIFEKQYPAYYNLKFRTDITEVSDVNEVIGGDANLLSYVLTKDRLFIFLVNSRNTRLFESEIDSAVYLKLNLFREMLSVMPRTSSVREPFTGYMDLAYDLYRLLMEPVVPYLKGDRIVVSPDNILSYIPLETLITEPFESNEILYREAPFALKKYRFSYIYSVTLSSESKGSNRRIRNNLIAFAPTYEEMTLSDSLLSMYPNLRGGISDLPYAVEEAKDVAIQCGGKAFTGMKASEDLYKDSVAGYNIVHLAMHTLLNDQHPAFSKMLFSRSANDDNDGFLNTYEVYGTALNALMVVLSSCNTGSGILVTGEGILSLARGFLFAGSKSVIMSMWEVEDKTGSEIVREFYHHLRKGESKSVALRKARLKYLEDADQTRSHPYFWATLVVYGDDAPLYYNGNRILAGITLFLLASLAMIWILYRDPMS